MIEVEDLWKSYGRFTAVKGISFTVPAGTVTGFLGPNGAGKSTAMRIMTTFLPAGHGRVRVAGFDVARSPRQVCERIGYMPESVALHAEMRVGEYLRHRAVLKHLRHRQVRTRVGEVMDECDLAGVERKLLGALSKGYRQRVGLADVLLRDPEVLILDEPTSGLDPLQVIEVRKLIDRLRGERTVLLSSHILGEVEHVCDHVVIIAQGEIRAQESRQGWHKRLEKEERTRVLVQDPPADLKKKLGTLGEDVQVSEEQVAGRVAPSNERAFLVRSDRDRRLQISRLASAEGWALLELSIVRTSLEDLFLQVTGDVTAGTP